MIGQRHEVADDGSGDRQRRARRPPQGFAGEIGLDRLGERGVILYMAAPDRCQPAARLDAGEARVGAADIADQASPAACVPVHDASLSREERRNAMRGARALRGRHDDEPLDRRALDEMRLDDFVDVRFVARRVPDALGIDDHQRPARQKPRHPVEVTETSGAAGR